MPHRLLLCVVLAAVGLSLWTGAAHSQPGETAETTGEMVSVPEPTETVARFYWTGNALWSFRMLWAIAIPGLIAFSGLGARMRRAAQGLWEFPFRPRRSMDDAAAETGVRNWLRRRQAPVAMLCFMFFMALMFLVSLPISYYAGYVRLHAYGISNQTLAKWATDQTLMLMVQIVIGGAVIWVPYMLMRTLPRLWWLVTGLLICPFIFFLALIMPVYIDPLFNEFGPMKDKDLETKILAIADRAGIEGSRVYEVEKSVDTNAINAYVTGFLNTKRIVLWDTLLERMTEEQVLFIMAHEMAHYVLGHVVRGVFFYSALILMGLWLANRIAHALIARYSGRLGFDRLSDAASLPLLVMTAQLVMFVMSPVGLAYSRHIELESDRFALELTRSNQASAQIWVDLMETNMAYPSPGPVYRLFRASHPTPADRITFANVYRPWETGDPMKYAHLFSDGGGD